MHNILNLLNEQGTQQNPANGWVFYVVMGVLIVGMIVMMIIPQRKQKKKAEEMMAKLAVGSIVTTIGGIIGTVTQITDTHIWIETGVEGSKTTMQLLRGAIHSIAPAEGSAEAVAEQKAEKQEANEDDEIK